MSDNRDNSRPQEETYLQSASRAVVAMATQLSKVRKVGQGNEWRLR